MPLSIIRQDITKMQVDAIVNAANETLLGGGGVDGAIHKAAGPLLLKECRTLGGCRTGQAKITKGYDLPCKYVIHTVGPVWKDGRQGEEQLLRSCYRNSLALAEEYECESIAFPLISSGVYGYPKDQALGIALDESRRFLMDHDMQIFIIVFDKKAFMIGNKLFSDVKAYIDDVYAREQYEENRRRPYQFGYPEPEDSAPYADMPQYNAQPYAAPPFPAQAPKKEEKTGFFKRRKKKVEEAAPAASISLDEMLKQRDEGFSQMLLRLIDEREMKDSECYKKANIDRKLFSKIKSNPLYKPSKPTTVAFALALEVDEEQTSDLLMTAGYALSHSYTFDIIIEYFIKKKEYDVLKINEVLFAFDQSLLGS